ncbi:prepilin-type N-terminal cleavage/methylation domain-containing protein [Candidatus Aerophobetes bacterium]|uniref:Prepilin-type N-terminal cleavage/methylation domain-containing protein n=1 Tax=Aerophobetes bacterium TaxID=2030807 RepID=A0A523TAY9_UNCAE|nr:MAG: prepilin-type N-terminal cleavage/methylation domain-containing protein [Candidatus Aerophobetes bacterium]
MNRQAGSSQESFTLIELLIVVAIITVLSSLVVVNFLQATQRAKRAAASSFIAALETAISMYKADMGQFPPDDNKGSASLREALSPPLDHPLWKNPKWNGPYMEFKENQVNREGKLRDPWSKGPDDKFHIYIYRANLDLDPSTSPPFHNRSSYDIYTPGSDARTGTTGFHGDEFADGSFCQNAKDDDKDGFIDELDPNGKGAANGYLEDDINNW